MFLAGVGVNLLGGEALRTPALVIQLVGAALLLANAARSRRDASADSGQSEG